MRGTGFEPNEGVTVAIENMALETTPPVVAANEVGSFSAAATVPALPPGQYKVVATGEVGSSATESMTIS